MSIKRGDVTGGLTHEFVRGKILQAPLCPGPVGRRIRPIFVVARTLTRDLFAVANLHVLNFAESALSNSFIM